MPATWLRVTVTSPSAELTPLVAEGLIASGGTAVEEQGAELTTYLPLTDGVGALVEGLRANVRAVAGIDVAVRHEEMPEQDWLVDWRAGLGARRVGPAIIVAPTWIDVEPAPGDILIRIDPQMAFGTGEHASTRGVLRLMQKVVTPGMRVVDVGAGSAILSIAAARLGADPVLAVENDPGAIPNALDNVAANGVAPRVSVLRALVDDAFLGACGAGSFDGILANVLSSVLRPLLPGFRRVLKDGGWAILSGILIEEAAAMREAAWHHGFAVEAEDLEDEWWGVLLRAT